MAIEQKAALNAGTVTGASVIADVSHLLTTFPLLSFAAIGAVGGLRLVDVAQQPVRARAPSAPGRGDRHRRVR
jgi:hypothetical protein